MQLMTEEQAEAKRAEIKIEVQKCEVRVQEMQCAIAKHRSAIAEIEVNVENEKLRKAALYVEWEGAVANAPTC